MKIQNNMQISFKGQRLATFVLNQQVKDAPDKPIQLFFTKLDRSDLKQLLAQREQLRKSRYGYWVLKDFIELLQKRTFCKEFFALEMPNESGTKNSIIALCSLFKGKGWTEIEILQKLDSSIKGAGAALLYGVGKRAKESNHRLIDLVAAREDLFDYYKKLGFQNFLCNPNKFILTSEFFDSFLKNIKSKYLN